MTKAETALHAVIGSRALLQARIHLAKGEIREVTWDPVALRARGSVAARRSGVATARIVQGRDGTFDAIEGACTCRSWMPCAHPAALLLTALAYLPAVPEPRRAEPDPPWEAALSTLVRRVGTAAPPADGGSVVGLQFELASERRIGLRPVVPGRSGGWIRTGISWSNLTYTSLGRSASAERHRSLLIEMATLSTVSDRHRYGYSVMPTTLFLDTFPTRRIWDLLREADESGMPLLQPGKLAAPVQLDREPARLSVRLERIGADLALAPVLLAGDVAVAPEHWIPIGAPPHGIAWWGVRGEPEPRPQDRVLRLTPLDRPMSDGMATAVAGPPVRIPAADEERFVERFLPQLMRDVEVVPAAGSVRLPAIGPAALTLTVTPLPGHRLALDWAWTVPVGSAQSREPLHAPAPPAEAVRRKALLGRVSALLREFPALLDVDSATIDGDAMLRFVGDVLPRLAECDGVAVESAPDTAIPDYWETSEPPLVTFADTGHSGQSDWFDLAVRVSVDGEAVVFEELFVALAEDRQYLILPSGAYFSLDRKELRQLRELIEESRALTDAPPGILRAGRFQAGLWDELSDVGEVTGPAADWKRSVLALCDTGAVVDHPVPAEVTATLRPYQRDGFRWLAALHGCGLGGILADDMGLGKTLQALALICHTRGRFLVVAPASVVHNWVSEAERFAPGLTVRAITQTRARRETDLADAVAGADVVVTSYTLFRLEYDGYAAVDWAGLVLDEAQFVKNPQSLAHRCAKRLPAPFKLAITGTPMENNLTELWALCSITAPGLFPRHDRFSEYYRTPIEKDRDAERLAQLRRRVRPLMLRRRKADVAIDLPPKQEQVLELDLDPKHRRVYQTYLQRERQKVLGLLGDLEKNRFEIFRSLTLLRQASLDVSLVDPKHRAVPSTKLDALIERVTDLVAEGHRTLVFSQFTRFLGAARDRLTQAGIASEYLDGSTRNRREVLAAFKSGTAPVFLISLKAGGFGLNLTEADYCILLDPWWNPATETQAVDRIHRIGQTRNVMVYRLVARDTIEEKVMALKARKAELFSSVLDGGEFASAGLTAADIRGLLQ